MRHAAAAADGLAALAGFPALTVSDEASGVAENLLAWGAIPIVASRDALHVGICCVNGIDFLLTWNFKHLANAAMRDRIDEACEDMGYRSPVICAPDALFEEKE